MRYFIASCLGSPDERSDIRVVLSRIPLALMRVMALCLALVHVPARAQDAIPVRIGWQPTTTVEAQIAHVMQRTDILERNGLKGQFTMFSFGPAVNEALVSGAVDIGFIGDMPSVSLAAVNAPISVIGRQSVFRGAILASAKSDIKQLSDLKGKKLHGPVGSSIYLAALAMLERANLKPGSDVEITNMGFADLSDAIRAGKIEAAFVWDPWVENFVEKGLARVLAEDTGLTMVIPVQDGFKKAHPAAIERFLRAHKEALLYAATHRDQANAWFQEPEVARQLSRHVVEKTTAYDPQWSARSLSDIRVSFSDGELERYLGLAKRAGELKIYPAPPSLQQKLDLGAAKKVDGDTWSFDPQAVKVK
jgi:ABC-type nitrate/sulfonate/bicarbonate transport system substrate-binding protein